ncbi:MAG: hypothetical protein Q8R55_06030 [Candidatus Taylorbacteria bacterium]|nr:hypothetical protein [Candidatus Taylorbacteria bacterium]
MEKAPSPETKELYDIKTLSPQTKMRYVLDIFDLGKDKEKNKERKNNFIKLIGEYHNASIVSKRKSLDSNITYIEHSDVNKKKIHDEIMDILTKMSLSLGLNKDQRELTDYLARNRDEVERMIGAYFLGYDPSSPQEQTTLKRAMRGDELFTSPPGKENE